MRKKPRNPGSAQGVDALVKVLTQSLIYGSPAELKESLTDAFGVIGRAATRIKALYAHGVPPDHVEFLTSEFSLQLDTKLSFQSPGSRPVLAERQLARALLATKQKRKQHAPLKKRREDNAAAAQNRRRKVALAVIDVIKKLPGHPYASPSNASALFHFIHKKTREPKEFVRKAISAEMPAFAAEYKKLVSAARSSETGRAKIRATSL